MQLSCRGLDVAPAALPDPVVPNFGQTNFGYQASYRADGREKPADKATDFWKALHNQNKGDGEAFARFNQQHNPKPRPMQQKRIAVAAVSQQGVAAASTGRCPQCRLPIGEVAYHLNNDPNGPLVHGECQAQLMLQKSKEEEEVRQKKDAAEKKARREEYEIGWKVDMVPLNAGPASRLGRPDAALEGKCCLVLDEASNTVSLTAATDPATAVNLEYLSLALQVRTRGGRDPMFSLDPKLGAKAGSVDELHAQWQVKRFEPEWLAGTSVGEVMFQADVHLKELSMGEYAQPVVGMKSCFEFLEQEGLKAEWCAREWFVVKRAEVLLSGEEGAGALVPFVEMGVEAREQIRHPDHVEDAPLTRKDHPLVRYAEAFTRYFDVIAERKSVIYHMRELAKATVLAKFLVDSKVNLDEAWYDLAAEAQTLRNPEIPQLWNERCHTSIQVRDGKIVDAGKEGTCATLRGVYGGVDFGTDRVQIVGFRRPVAAVLTEIPRGVDLNLDQFNLSAPRRSSPSGGCTILEGKDAKVPMGKSFWKSIIPGAPSAYSEGHKSFFRDLFNPSLSDRRSEGDLFMPPEPNMAYVSKLRSLLQEEVGVVSSRKEHFCSEAFDISKANPLFPASWAPTGDIVKQQPEQLQYSPPWGGQLQSRVKLHSGAAGMERVMQEELPVFDKMTEEGTRFRVYQVGAIEIRTIQEDGKKEIIGAAFSSRAPAKVGIALMTGGIKDEETFVKAVEYVESGRTGSKSSVFDCRYYAVLETDRGHSVVTERLADGTLTWEENSMTLEARNYLAKVTRYAECRNACVSVGHMKAHRQSEAQRSGSGSHAADSEAYAHGVLARASKPSAGGPPIMGSFPGLAAPGFGAPGFAPSGYAVGGYSVGYN